MYTLSIPNETFTVATLAGVIALFANERVKDTETSSISLLTDGVPASVTRYNGTLALRCPGTAARIVARPFDEVRAFWLGHYSTDAQPWHIRRAHWDELFGALRIGSCARTLPVQEPDRRRKGGGARCSPVLQPVFAAPQRRRRTLWLRRRRPIGLGSRRN